MHDSAIPIVHALFASHIEPPPPMAKLVQQTLGGVQTFAPHGKVPPSTIIPASPGTPPLLLPLPPLLLLLPPLLLPVSTVASLPPPLPLPLPEPLSALLLVDVVLPPHAHADNAVMAPSTARILIRCMTSLPSPANGSS